MKASISANDNSSGISYGSRAFALPHVTCRLARTSPVTARAVCITNAEVSAICTRRCLNYWRGRTRPQLLRCINVSPDPLLCLVVHGDKLFINEISHSCGPHL